MDKLKEPVTFGTKAA